MLQIKAKTELLLSAEAAKTAQRADLQNHLDTAQNALQDKQQVGDPEAAHSIACVWVDKLIPHKCKGDTQFIYRCHRLAYSPSFPPELRTS